MRYHDYIPITLECILVYPYTLFLARLAAGPAPVCLKTRLGVARMELSTQALSSLALMLLAKRNLSGGGTWRWWKNGW